MEHYQFPGLLKEPLSVGKSEAYISKEAPGIAFGSPEVNSKGSLNKIFFIALFFLK